MANKEISLRAQEAQTERKTSVVHLEEKTAMHAQDGDEETARYAAERIEIDEATNKRLFWKINKTILPIMLGTYFCQSLDKGTLGFSSIMGIRTDAHLANQEFSWLGTILYMGILAGEYPTNFLLQKLPVAKYLAANVFLWGAVVTCSAASKTFGSLMAVRFLLGLFESCVQPAFIILTSVWYRREEQSVLTSLWYCMTGVQLMVGGLIAFGVSHYKGDVLFSWQLLFLILGLATITWSAVIFFVLPDSPMRAKFFTEEERKMLVERVRSNETGIQNKKYKKYQVIEALTDPFVWCCVALILVANLVIGGLGVFSNLIIKQFGFSVLQTQLLNIAQGAVTIIVMVGSAALSEKTGQTCLVMVVWTIPAVIGTGIIIGIKPTASNAGGLLIAFYCTQFFLAQGNMVISLISRNVAGQTKKGICLTMTFVGWAVGNMIAPQIFQEKDAPRYIKGFVAHIVIYGVYLVIVVVTRLLLLRRNVMKRRAASGVDDHDIVSHDLAFQDLTDKENPNFRYVY